MTTLTTLYYSTIGTIGAYENLSNSLYGQTLRNQAVMMKVIPCVFIVLGVMAILGVFLTHSTTKSANNIKQYEADVRLKENETKAEIAKLEAENKLAEAKIKAASDLERTVVASGETNELVEAARRILLAHNYNLTNLATNESRSKETLSNKLQASTVNGSENTDDEISSLALALMESVAKDKLTVQRLIEEENQKEY